MSLLTLFGVQAGIFVVVFPYFQAVLGWSGLRSTLALMPTATFVSVDGGYRSVLPGMLAMALGMGLTMTPSTEAITSALPNEQQGVASALNDALIRESFVDGWRQALWVGVAVMAVLFAYVLARGPRRPLHRRADAGRAEQEVGHG